MPTPKKPINDRYIINSITGCWEWIASINAKGYGTLETTILGWRQNMLAHKYFFIIYKNDNKDIPENLEVHHTCFNRKCVNPEHLELLTHKDNCREGRKLTQEQVDKIRQEYPYKKLRQLAKEYNVTIAYISLIVNNKLWV